MILQIPSTSTPHSSNTTINTAFITKERHRKQKQKKEDLTEHRQFLQVCTDALTSATSNEVGDDSAAFGAYVGSKLKTITDTSQKMYAESLITQVLQKAVMNKLSETTMVTDQREPTYVNPFWYPHYSANGAHTSSRNNTTVTASSAVPRDNLASTMLETTSAAQFYSNFENL